ncbi:hypothetical protein ACGFYV_26215 [Streptomyces sp. NPDC048297]|uniref:hypothetical protein n=1 Tax=Streptomyces sp. NPDC048297 TaxID=3365531 RepID=UPI00371F990C
MAWPRAARSAPGSWGRDLHGLLWPDEIRDPATAAPATVPLDDDEVDEALALVDAMTRDDLTGQEFTDHYTEALHEVIEAKQKGDRLPEATTPDVRPGQLVDLMTALQESVDKAQAARGEGEADVREPPAKKTANAPSGKQVSSGKARPRA